MLTFHDVNNNNNNNNNNSMLCEVVEEEERQPGELKRPDLKGSFRCSLCGKVFCHSSSLSRHRMQAHFKSYRCTLCTKEITSNETLRAHMYKQHQISRMFLCRCCNWAFPDKTSLHLHIQSREESKGGDKMDEGVPLPQPLPLPRAPHPGFAMPLPGSAHANPAPSLPAPQPINIQTQPLPLSYLPPPQNDDLMARIRERLMLNQLMAQQNMAAAAWLHNLPDPAPLGPAPPLTHTTVITAAKDEEDEEINVNDVVKMESGSETDEPSSESGSSVIKTRVSSPAGRSCSSLEGCSAAAAPPPLAPPSRPSIFSETSAFQPTLLKLDPPSSHSICSHASPAETASSASPQSSGGHCFDCCLYKAKLADAETRARYHEARTHGIQHDHTTSLASLQLELARLRQQVSAWKQQAALLRPQGAGLAGAEPVHSLLTHIAQYAV